MGMATQNKKIPEFRDLTTPLFFIEDLVELTEVQPATLRMWVSRGSVRLLASTTPGREAGRGNKAQYSIRDALQFLLFAKLSKFTISPSAIDEECMGDAMNIILDRLNEIAAGCLYGNSVNPFDDNQINPRFFYIFPHNGKLWADELYGRWEGGEWITFDVVDFVTRVLKIYNRRTGSSPI